MRRLPSLNGLKAFEAAARTGSFSEAATELGVSPAAISRLVRLLEERLGVTFFERAANSLTLTAAGFAYQRGLTPLFDAIATLTEQVTAPPRPAALVVGVGPTFAVRWLIPRLGDFRAREPGVDVHITMGGAAADFADDWTCGVKLGDGHWPGLVAEPLFRAELTPVCTPAMAERLRASGDLDPGALLRVSHSPDDWPIWLRAAGLAEVRAQGPQLGFYGQAIQAAIDGVGIAMGITPYIDDDLAAGRLVAPFETRVPKDVQWYLIYPAQRLGEREFEAFRDWIVAAAQPGS
ncbi:MAG: LysR family transcriptional regulator [Hyphomicrobiales bacterium]|nr:LysR family transcriptional regulator [Hyphomicrobiales bacterium]